MGTTKYLLYLTQAHTGFRKAELESLADLYNVQVDISDHDESSPFLIVDIQNDNEDKISTDKIAHQWVQRSILCRSIYELWGQGTTDEELHASVKANSLHLWEKFTNMTFKFDFESYQGRRDWNASLELIDQFRYMSFKAKAKLKNPEVTYVVLEDYSGVPSESTDAEANAESEIAPLKTPRQIYLGRLVGRTERENNILDTYELKKRKYVGTTSFDAELSLISVNIAQANHYKVLYDPFVGTGSFLVAGAKFGAVTIGSDIDIKTLIGKNNRNINSNFKQYGTLLNFIDVATMDFTHNALRKDFVIDTICCDPPYGVREGLKVLGAAKPERHLGKENIEIDGMKAFLRRDYVQPKKPYQLGNMLDDLLEFAADRLPVGGRLVYWMPVANDEDYTTSIPHHEKLQLKYNCVQKFNRWSRRLLCYVKQSKDYKGKTIKAGQVLNNEFRERYFSGFSKLSLEDK